MTPPSSICVRHLLIVAPEAGRPGFDETKESIRCAVAHTFRLLPHRHPHLKALAATQALPADADQALVVFLLPHVVVSLEVTARRIMRDGALFSVGILLQGADRYFRNWKIITADGRSAQYYEYLRSGGGWCGGHAGAWAGMPLPPLEVQEPVAA